MDNTQIEKNKEASDNKQKQIEQIKIDNQNLKEGGKEDGEKTKAKTTRRTRKTT